MTTEQPLPLTVHGVPPCEDTAITVSRLRALGIPFRDVDLERDEAAAAHVRALNGGHRITPTLVFGDDVMTVAEPTLERVTVLLAEAGYDVTVPKATQLHGDVAARAIPLRRRSSLRDGTVMDLGSLRGRRQVALLLAHEAGCLACLGYARQLARAAEPLAAANGVAVVVVDTGTGDHDPSEWSGAVDDVAWLLGDDDGSWKATIGERLGIPHGEVALVLLDRYLAPRAISVAPEAGGLIDPSEAVSWLAFLDLECAECTIEVAWSESPSG